MTFLDQRSRPKVSKSHCVISQEPFCGVRTHFYHDASSYDMFRDRRVVEPAFLFRRLLKCNACSSWETFVRLKLRHGTVLQHANLLK